MKTDAIGVINSLDLKKKWGGRVVAPSRAFQMNDVTFDMEPESLPWLHEHHGGIADRLETLVAQVDH